MYKVLVSALHRVGIFSNVFSIMEKGGCKVIKSSYPHPIKEKELLKIIPGIDAVITGADEITSKVIQAADKLKVIAKYGVGVDNIDTNAATKRKIVVAYAPNQNAVADLAVGLMFCLGRRICEANTAVKAGEWQSFIGSETWQKTLGVIGAGRIGQAVIKRVRSLQMKVLVYDVCKNDEIAEELEFEYTSLERLLKEADFITIHLPLNNATKDIIGKEEIQLIKPSAYLINTARGGIIDENALYTALKEKRLAGAALDAHVKEPPIANSPLIKLDNVISTPHMGSSSQDTLKNMDLITAENVLRVLRGENPLYSFNFPFS